MSATASFVAANTTVLREPKIQIGTFQGLKSANTLALSKRSVHAFWVSSPSNHSVIRAVSTVRFLLNPFLSVFTIWSCTNSSSWWVLFCFLILFGCLGIAMQVNEINALEMMTSFVWILSTSSFVFYFVSFSLDLVGRSYNCSSGGNFDCCILWIWFVIGFNGIEVVSFTMYKDQRRNILTWEVY